MPNIVIFLKTCEIQTVLLSNNMFKNTLYVTNNTSYNQSNSKISVPQTS
jgi:hypothetical protein